LSEASRGWQAAHGGNRSEAEAWFRAAIQQAPRLHEALGALVRLQTESGQLDSAFATLNRARRAGMPNADYHAHAALVLSARGEWEAALEELRKVPAGAAQDPILEDVIGVARAQIEAAPP
jgi:tetratricopeptide (TPR) repeat protein